MKTLRLNQFKSGHPQVCLRSKPTITDQCDSNISIIFVAVMLSQLKDG